MAYKGRFIPKYPEKYKGDPTNIIFRSLWERRVMSYLDENINAYLGAGAFLINLHWTIDTIGTFLTFSLR